MPFLAGVAWKLIAAKAAKRVWVFLKSIPIWVYLAIGGLIGVYAYGERKEGIGFEAGKLEVQTEFDKYKAGIEEASRLAREEARDDEEDVAEADKEALEEFREQSDATIAEKDRIIADIRADNLRLRDRFRHQDTAGVPSVPGDGPSNTGTRECGLRRADEEFLISYAARADGIVHKLAACQAKIEAIEKAQNG